MRRLTYMDEPMRDYYDRRAEEYDDWWLGLGLFAERERPGWGDEVDQLVALLASLPPARTLDVACGTGFLTRHLPGEVVALDQSAEMLRIAQRARSDLVVVRSAATELPFAAGAFERVFTSHFYGHLTRPERTLFLSEARRVGGELIVVDSALHDGVEREQWQERRLNDGSVHPVYKRYFTAPSLADELGGGQVVHAGRWFVVVSA